jgi:hypothetical protein
MAAPTGFGVLIARPGAEWALKMPDMTTQHERFQKPAWNGRFVELSTFTAAFTRIGKTKHNLLMKRVKFGGQ